MRKQSFLSFSIILMLFLSGCTKEDFQSYPSVPVENNTQEPYSFSYSNWIPDANLSWSDAATTEPSRQSELAIPELTQEMLDAGSFVLLYAQSNIDGSVQSMPAEFSNTNNNEVNGYSINHVAGSVTLFHTRSVNGAFEVPNDSNEISFRFIIVNPNTPDPNGRQMTIDDFRQMSYKEVVNLLGIPE